VDEKLVHLRQRRFDPVQQLLCLGHPACMRVDIRSLNQCVNDAIGWMISIKQVKRLINNANGYGISQIQLAANIVQWLVEVVRG
jgi:hypothetical protein